MQQNETGFFNLLGRLGRWHFILLIALISVPLLYSIFDPQPSIIDDNFHYMNLARQMYSGKGYTDPYAETPTPETHVAPGYPFILSIIMRLAGDPKPIVTLKIFNALCYLLSIIAIALIFDKHLKVNRWVTLLFSIFMILNKEIACFASMVTTEAPFLCFSVLTILFFLEYGESKRTKYFILASLFTVLALYIRIPGAPLAVACFLWLIWRKEYKQAVIYAAIVGVLVGAWVFPLIFSGSFQYMQQVGKVGLDTSKLGKYDSFITRYLHHLFSYIFKFIPNLFIPHHSPFLYKGSEIGIFSWLGLAIGLPISVFSIWGIAKTLKNKTTNLVTIYAGLYYLIYSVFASHGARYASYAFPFIFFLAMVGFVAFLDRIKLKRVWRIIAIIAALAFIVLLEGLPSFISDMKLTSKTRENYRKYGAEYTELTPLYRYKHEPLVLQMHKALRWCAKNIPEGEVILASQYRTAHFLTERRVVCPLYVQKYFTVGYEGFIAEKSVAEIDSLGEWMLQNKVKYVVYDPIYNISNYFLRPTMTRYQDCFKELYRTDKPSTIIFEVDTVCLRSAITKGNREFIEYYKSLHRANVAQNKTLLDSLLAIHDSLETEGEDREVEKICRTHNYLMVMKNIEEAQMLFEGAVLLYPKNPVLWLNRGIDLNKTGFNELSIIALEKARTFGAKESDCYNNIATAYANMKQYDKALEYFKIAAKKDPFDAVIFKNIISVFIYQEDFASAEATIRQQLARTDVDSTFIKQIESAAKQYSQWKAKKQSGK